MSSSATACIASIHTETLAPHKESWDRRAARTILALDDARQRSLRVVAICPYVRDFVERHPEMQDIVVGMTPVADGRRAGSRTVTPLDVPVWASAGSCSWRNPIGGLVQGASLAPIGSRRCGRTAAQADPERLAGRLEPVPSSGCCRRTASAPSRPQRQRVARGSCFVSAVVMGDGDLAGNQKGSVPDGLDGRPLRGSRSGRRRVAGTWSAPVGQRRTVSRPHQVPPRPAGPRDGV